MNGLSVRLFAHVANHKKILKPFCEALHRKKIHMNEVPPSWLRRFFTILCFWHNTNYYRTVIIEGFDFSSPTVFDCVRPHSSPNENISTKGEQKPSIHVSLVVSYYTKWAQLDSFAVMRLMFFRLLVKCLSSWHDGLDGVASVYVFHEMPFSHQICFSFSPLTAVVIIITSASSWWTGWTTEWKLLQNNGVACSHKPHLLR